jgi:hypothetical protein
LPTAKSLWQANTNKYIQQTKETIIIIIIIITIIIIMQHRIIQTGEPEYTPE